MENSIDQIEKLLRGQMSEKEERVFKQSLMTNVHLRSDAFIMAYMVRMQKSG